MVFFNVALFHRYFFGDRVLVVTKFLYADTIISCVLSGFLFVIVVEDDEREAMSRSSLCVKNVANTTAVFNSRSRVVLVSLS